MMAIGFMNIAGSCSSCYVTTGSFLRSAVNYNAGAQTAVSNIVMAAAVLVTAVSHATDYFTPNIILAAIIITAVIGLIDYQAAFRLLKVDKLDFLACLSSFFGVLFFSVPLGPATAVLPSENFFFSVILINDGSNTFSVHCRLEFQFSRFSCMSPGQTPWF
ncbi:hypothetical protein FNV43_RR06881 [Rhamnella rubrinervis]|uniref:SLC26A/SulP transporter domain-containing protein n=1 Tax=Rhamnella rubrinervis TaxID=2594499 RepID=A0A8K0HDV6_9ROSA|nr:hypothetical protein FNV43_RR06881 [Rhamnella rubrinervis]